MPEEMTSRPDQIMYPNGIGACRQQALVGAPLVIVVEQLHPKQDFSFLDSLLQMGCMAGNKPAAKRGLHGRGSRGKPPGEAISNRSCRAANPATGSAEQVHCLPAIARHGISEHALLGQVADVIKQLTPGIKGVERLLRFRPGVESSNGEA